MSFELSSLIFQTDTSKLKEAKAAIDDLAVSMQGLNKSLQEESKTAIASSKAKEAEAKASLAATKANDALVKSVENKAKAEEQSSSAVSKSTSVLERQQDVLNFMTEGFSRGQSSILAYAKSTGILGDELKQLEVVLQTQRKLIGGDPFDKSISGLVALANKYREIKEAIRQYNAESGLTREQTRELTRDKERLIERMKLEGATLSEIKSAIREHNAQYTSLANKVNTLTSAEKQRERQIRDTANAVRNVQAAEERLFSTMQHLNDGLSQNATLNERAALALGSYERNLRLAGFAGDEAAKKLNAFKVAQEQVSKVEEQRRINQLSRSLTPQVSDVAVSLYGGMSPMTVLMQQGLQVRDLIAQSRVESDKLGTAFRQAGKDMAESITGTAAAMGSLLVGSIMQAGKALTLGLVKPFIELKNVVKELAAYNAGLNIIPAEMGPNIESNVLALRNLKGAFDALKASAAAAAITIGVVIAALGTGLLVAAYQVMKATNEMNSQLIQFGAMLGVTSGQAKELASTLSNVTGETFAASLETVGKFAKSGISDFKELSAATASAIELQKYLGIEVSTTAEKYQKVTEDPVKGLIELAKNTGLVTEAEIRHIRELEKKEGKTKAVAEAVKLVTRANEEMAVLGKENLSEVEKLWIDIKKAANEAWGAVQKAATDVDMYQGFRDVLAKIKLSIQQALTLGEGFVRLLKEIITFNATGDFTAKLNSYIDSKLSANLGEYEQTMKDIYDTSVKSTAQQEREAKARQANANAANRLKDEFKDEDKAKKKSLKDVDDLEKAYQRVIEKFSDLKIQAQAAGTDMNLPIEATTKAYVALQDVIKSPEWDKWTTKEKEKILLHWEEANALEVKNILLKKQEDALKKLQTVWDNFAKLNLKYDEEIKAANEELNFQTSILFKSETQIKKMTREYEEQKNIAKINAEYEKERLNLLLEYNQAIKDVDPLTANILQTDYLNRQAEIEKKSQEKVLIERQKTNLKVVQDFEKKWRDIQDGISDALYTSLTKGGKEGAKQFRKFMEEQLKKEFVLPAIKAVVNLVTESGLSLVGAGISALMGSSASSGSSGSASSLGNIAGLASNAKSAYGLYTGGQAAYTAYTADLALTSAEASTAALQYLYSGDWGTALGLYLKGLISPASTTAAPAAAATTGSTASMGLGTALGYMAAIAVAFNLLTESKTRYLDTSITGTLGPEGLTNGMIGDRYKYTGNLLDAGGTDLEWRPLTSNQAEYDAFYMNMRFGNYRNNATALQSAGYLGDNIDPYTLQQVPFTQEQIDTAFSKLVEDTYALDTRINRTGSGETVATELEQGGALKLAFEAIYKSAKDSLQKTADLFGDKSLGALLENYVSQINIQTSGSLADAIGQYAEGLISGMGAAWLPAVETLRQTTETDGKKITETWSAAFNRLVNESLVVNSILKVMGTSMQEVFGKDNTNNILTMSNSLVKIFGSIDNLNNSFNAYYSNFYSTAEKTARQWEQVDAVFASLNISAPRTREGFRGIVEGLDLNTSKGQSAFKALMDVQAAFAALTPVTEEVVAVITKLNHLSADYDEYFSKYYSAEDNRVRNIQKITQTLNNAGFSLTTDQVAKATTQQFKDLVAYFYSMGEAGITAVNALMEVQGAFYALNEAVDTVTKRVNSEIGNQAQEKALDDYNNALQGYTTETTNALQTQLNSQKQLADDYKKIAEDMRKYRSTLQVSDTNPQGILDRYSIAKAKFSSTSALAATGNITAMSGLTSVAQDFLGLSKATAGSKGQYAVDYAKVLAALDVTEIKAQSEADRLQASVDSINAQMNNISSNATSATKSLLSIDAAMKALLEAVKASAGIGAGATSATVDAINKAGLGSTWVDTSTGKPATSNTTTADKMYVSSRGAVITYTPTGLGKLTSSAGSYTHDQIIAAAQAAQAGGNLRGIYNWAWDNGITLSELDAILGMPGNTAASWAIANGLPTFASGGRYGGGVALVGEEGPELINFRNPGQVYNASQTRGILNADNSELLNALINEVSLLRAETRATAIHSAKTSKILDRAIGKDDSLNVSVVA